MTKWKNRITGLLILMLLAALAFLLKQFFSGKYNSLETFQAYIQAFGISAPLVLILFQFLQVILPVLPGFVGCGAGAVMFGTVGGFWCNYIGICAGSMGAYLMARRFGIDLVLMMFPRQMYDRWQKRIEKSRSFGWFLFAATLLPLFPDDFLCYFSGLVKMDFKKFFWIILLGKPWCILAYSIAFGLL